MVVVALSCVAFAILLLGVVFWVVSLKYSHLPGDLGSPVFGNLAKVFISFFKHSSKESYERMLKVIRDKGETVTVWFGPAPAIITADPLVVEDMLKSGEVKDKEPFVYGTLYQVAPGPFSRCVADEKWKSYRKEILLSLTQKCINSYMEIFVKYCSELKESLKELNGKETDIFPRIVLFMTDVLLGTHCGSDLGMLKSNNFNFTNSMLRYMAQSIGSTINPINHLLPSFLAKLTVIPEVYEFYTKCQQAVCQKIQSKYNSEERPTFVYAERILINSLAEGKSLDFVIRQYNELYFEGVIPCSNTISLACLFMATNPNVQCVARKEQDEIFQGKRRDTTLADLKDMEYLERVINETLRFGAPPMTFRRISREIHAGTITIPRNSTVAILMCHAMTNPKYWKEPTKFNPDNFLPENMEKRPKVLGLSFGLPPRNCPGVRYSMTLMKTVLSTILCHFEITSSLSSSDQLRFVPGFVNELDGLHSVAFRPREAMVLEH